MALVGAVIVTHCLLAEELLKTAEEIVGKLQKVEAVSIHADERIEQARKKIEDAIKRVNSGAGVIIFTDLFGGTPSNISLSFLGQQTVEVITGINLPMLMKWPALQKEEDLKTVAERLCAYGQKNILVASEYLSKKK